MARMNTAVRLLVERDDMTRTEAETMVAETRYPVYEDNEDLFLFDDQDILTDYLM